MEKVVLFTLDLAWMARYRARVAVYSIFCCLIGRSSSSSSARRTSGNSAGLALGGAAIAIGQIWPKPKRSKAWMLRTTGTLWAPLTRALAACSCMGIHAKVLEKLAFLLFFVLQHAYPCAELPIVVRGCTASVLIAATFCLGKGAMSPLLGSCILKPCNGHGSTGRFYDKLGGAALNTIQQLDEVKRVSWFASSATNLKLKTSCERSDTIQVADFLA